MHSQMALTEHASLNLAQLILLDPVVEIYPVPYKTDCVYPSVGGGALISQNMVGLIYHNKRTFITFILQAIMIHLLGYRKIYPICPS